MGAMIHARVENLIFAAADPKTGAVLSRYQIGSDGRLNHNIRIEFGILAKESSELLSRFFKERRKQ
jgi:tRNA(adenine34) deaminase